MLWGAGYLDHILVGLKGGLHFGRRGARRNQRVVSEPIWRLSTSTHHVEVLQPFTPLPSPAVHNRSRKDTNTWVFNDEDD
jgi:hypothetical protein